MYHAHELVWSVRGSVERWSFLSQLQKKKQPKLYFLMVSPQVEICIAVSNVVIQEFRACTPPFLGSTVQLSVT